jgi:hypothetical protein
MVWEGPFNAAEDKYDDLSEGRETGMPTPGLNQDPVAFYGLDSSDSVDEDESMGAPETPEGIEEEQL